MTKSHNICDECETVKHCSKNGCIPKVEEQRMLQDEDREFSKWLSNTLGARRSMKNNT